MEWYYWASLAALALIFELMSPTFFAIFVAAGFAASAISAYLLPELLSLQLVVASIGMVVGAIVFKKKNQCSTNKTSSVGQIDEFVGKNGIFTGISNGQTAIGKTLFDEPIFGEKEWASKTADGSILDVGTKVSLVEVRGSTMIIERTK